MTRSSLPPPNKSRYRFDSSTTLRQRLTVCVSQLLLLWICSCATPQPPQIVRQLVLPPTELLVARPMPAWTGGDYGALGNYAVQLQSWGLQAENDKHAMRDYVQKQSGR